ncbi:MAG: hypothetical protein WDN46_14685 [Methylocella sp.]
MADNPSRLMTIGYVPAAGLGIGGIAATITSPVAAAGDAELLAIEARYEGARALVIEAGETGDYPDDFVFIDSDVAEEMVDLQAKTAAGLKVKARAIFHERGYPDEYLNDMKNLEREDVAERLIISLIEDILKL